MWSCSVRQGPGNWRLAGYSDPSGVYLRTGPETITQVVLNPTMRLAAAKGDSDGSGTHNGAHTKRR